MMRAPSSTTSDFLQCRIYEDELAAYGRAILTGKLALKQNKSGKWSLDLGQVAFEWDEHPNYDTLQLVDLAQEALEPHVVEDEWEECPESEPGTAQAKPAEPEPPSMPQPEPELEPATPPPPAAEPDRAPDDAPERPAFPEPWRDQFEICIDAWFRYCDLSGIVSLRSFDQNDKGKPPFRITPTSLKGGLKFLMEAAEDDARRAAYNPKPIVFCPPIATFTNTKHAGEEDLFEGPVLSVDLDKNPRAALAMLERLLGPATLVVRSGGVWTNPQTGEAEDKLHAHWRLKEPARGKEQLAKLKEARSLATILVDGDRNNIPISHPLRWPGSWHRKGTPRLCEIVEQRPDNEIDLDVALATLEDVAPQLREEFGFTQKSEVAPKFETAPGLDIPFEDLGENIETTRWWDRLSPEHKDAALDHGLECIATNSKLLQLEDYGGNRFEWFRITASIARSDAPRAEDIFVKHARTATKADPPDVLRKYFRDCQKNPRGITIGTFIRWAKQCGANFEPWLETYQSTIEPTKVKQRYEPVARDAPELVKLDAVWMTRIFEGDTDGKYQNELAFAVACELVRVELNDEFIARVLMTTLCGVYVQENPPYRLNRTIRRAHEFAIDPDLEKMNSKHAVLPIGGKTRVITWGNDLEFPGRKTIVWAQTFRDFKDLHSNKRKQILVGKDEDDGKPTMKSVPLGAWWLAQRRRRQYDGGQKFMPQHLAEVVGDTLNMFEGFPIQPRKPEGRSAASACNLILDHGFKIICSGDEEHWDYLLKREALIAQERRRSEVAVALRTDAEGAGKGIWCNTLGHLYGSHYMQINKPEHVIGKFNPHLEILLKLCADEAIFAGDPRHRNTLFNLITEPTLTIEPKNINVYSAPNFLNSDILSNAKRFVPPSKRRLFVPTVSENRVDDLEYFNAIKKQQLNDGGAEALLYHLLYEVDLRHFDVRKVPKTAGLLEQIELSRKGLDGLVEKICNEAAVPCPHPEWPGFSVSTGYEERAGFDFFIANHHDRELRDLGPLKVKRELRKNWECQSGDDAQRRDGDKLIRGIKWPRLQELRELFVSRHGPQDWLHSEITEWSKPTPTTPENNYYD